MQAESVSSKRYLSTPEAAQYLGVSKAFLDKSRCTGLNKVPFTKVGRLVRYDRVALDRWMTSRSTGQAA